VESGRATIEPCTQIHRIERIEQDIKELQKTDREHAKDITEFKEGQAGRGEM